MASRNKSSKAKRSEEKEAAAKIRWREILSCYYPNIFSRSYCVPPIYFNRVPYDVTEVSGRIVLVAKPAGKQETQAQSTGDKYRPKPVTPHIVRPEHAQGDFSQQHVVANLQVLAQHTNQVLFILPEFQYANYLNKDSEATARMRKMTQEKGQKDGDFDFLIISKQKGILVGEIKSIGKTDETVTDKTLGERIQKALEQLEKGKLQVITVISDIAPEMTVRTTLVLPYITNQRLQQFVSQENPVSKDLCQCLGAASQSEAIDLCLCADQLSDPDTYWDVNDEVLSKLSTWWRLRMATDDPNLCGPGGEELYLDILARFVGPASTVSVHCTVPPRIKVGTLAPQAKERESKAKAIESEAKEQKSEEKESKKASSGDMRTLGQAVAELGHRLSLLVLTQQQLDILTRDPPLACISGPPGTGKTVLLVLQGLKWLRQGRDVHIVSQQDFSSLAATCLIENQLNETKQQWEDPTAGSVLVHTFNFYQDGEDVKATSQLQQAAREGTLCVIMDEVLFENGYKPGEAAQRLVKGLFSDGNIETFCLWCTTGAPSESVPDCLKAELLTMPLRSAPAVIREVRPAMTSFPVSPYCSDGIPAPGDGPTVRRLHHSGDGHSGAWPVDCEVCGQNVAEQLRDIGVGDEKHSPLSWRDVFVLTRIFAINDETKGQEGRVSPPASGIVRGLRAAKVPVGVMGRPPAGEERAELEKRVNALVKAEADQVTVAYFPWVRGLERPVVVWLVGRCPREDDKNSDEVLDIWDRLNIVTRCSAQLVIVDVLKAETETVLTECSATNQPSTSQTSSDISDSSRSCSTDEATAAQTALTESLPIPDPGTLTLTSDNSSADPGTRVTTDEQGE